MTKQGFPPIVNADCRLLLLGSLPGDASIAQQEYYAHPRNLFWTFIARITQEAIPHKYPEKQALILKHHIALWDVTHHAERPGSLDSAILQPVANDIPLLLIEHPEIGHIFFNGQTSFKLFKRFFPALLQSDRYISEVLPSTSPANASIKTEIKFRQWQQALRPVIFPGITG